MSFEHMYHRSVGSTTFPFLIRDKLRGHFWASYTKHGALFIKKKTYTLLVHCLRASKAKIPSQNDVHLVFIYWIRTSFIS